MSAFLLLSAIRDYLSPRLAGFPLGVHRRERPVDQEQNEQAICKIFLGSMPPTSNDAYSAAPFLVIQAMDGEDLPDGLANFRVSLRLCIVAEECEAAESDLLNLISELRLWLMELPGGVLPGGKFRLDPEEAGRLPWTRPDEQVHPFLQAFIFTEWQSIGVFKRPSPNMVDYE